MKVKHLSSFATQVISASEIEVDEILVYEVSVPKAISPSISTATKYLPTVLNTESGPVPITADSIVFINVVDLANISYELGEYGNSGSYIKIDSATKNTGKIPFDSPFSISSVSSPTIKEVLGDESPASIKCYNSKNQEVKLTILIGVKV